MGKLWGGRFEQGLDDAAQALSYSLWLDRRLAPYDIQVNKAHVAGLVKAGVLTEQDGAKIRATLDEIGKESQETPELLDGPDEDIHSCIERLVTERIGDLGKKMHAGKSRNDQVVTDVKLCLKDAIIQIQGLLLVLLKTLWERACRYEGVIFPGFTHFQPAQPVLLAHHFLAYFQQFERDLTRLKQLEVQVDICPLGAGALAGNNYGIDREAVAKELGFSAVTQNSMDAVSDRDYLFDFCAAASVIMTHMSRFCEELVIFSSPLVNFIQVSDTYSTGSSIMPQKKNPDIAELIRGKAGGVLGNLVNLHHTVKALPLTYNRDLQEDKPVLFETIDTLVQSLTCMSGMIATLSINKPAIEAALTKGYLEATELADYLVGKKLPFRDAHEVTGKVVLTAIEKGVQLKDLSLDQLQEICPDIEEDVYDMLSLESAVAAKDVLGGTAPQQVKAQIDRIGEKYQWKRP
ncbi:MAG: argininosuccinate lyase [Actinobacteria bacterium]|nr:argininosuccinate lyase [Actinomycetota bacterium]